MDKLKEQWQKLYAALTRGDYITWLTHFVLGLIPCILLFAISPLASLIGARVYVYGMLFREGYQWARGQGGVRDHLMDMVGPILNDVIWSVVFYG